MKKICGCIGVFMFLVVSSSLAAQTVPSHIKDITLFSSQALVKRVAHTEVTTGLHELLLEVDAFHIDGDSVSAKVFGAGEVFSVQFKGIAVKESPQENILALEQKIKEKTQAKRKLVDEKGVLIKKEQFLQSLIDFSKTQVPREMKTSFPKIQDLNQTLSFLSSNFKTIDAHKQSIDASVEEITKDIKVLEEKLGAIQRPHKKTSKIIEILFNSKKKQQIRIEAEYLTQNAYWGPLYKVAVPLDLKDVELTMFSKIRQKTGEDWKNVLLSVSNVIPLRGVELPPPRRWVLDYPEPRAQAMKRQELVAMSKVARPGADEAMEGEPEGEAEPREEASVAYARRQALPLSFEYRMPRPLDIESRDKETILPLFSRKLKGEFFYYSVPGSSALTFLVCKATGDKELLSGPLSVYFGGRFVGKTFIREKKAGEEFHLNLGADREVKVKREKIKDKIKETFFGKIERNTIVRELAFKITVENMKDGPAHLRILDAIPISRTDKVEVKDIRITPEPKEKNYQDKEGVMLWEYTLEPREKQEISIEFTVTYPKDFPIRGL